MSKIMSLGEELQELLDKGLERDEAKAVMDHRHKRVTQDLKCPKCGETNTYRRGRRCSHEFKCRDCGYWWCAHQQLMSPEDRELRRNFSRRTRASAGEKVNG